MLEIVVDTIYLMFCEHVFATDIQYSYGYQTVFLVLTTCSSIRICNTSCKSKRS